MKNHVQAHEHAYIGHAITMYSFICRYIVILEVVTNSQMTEQLQSVYLTVVQTNLKNVTTNY